MFWCGYELWLLNFKVGFLKVVFVVVIIVMFVVVVEWIEDGVVGYVESDGFVCLC